MKILREGSERGGSEKIRGEGLRKFVYRYFKTNRKEGGGAPKKLNH